MATVISQEVHQRLRMSLSNNRLLSGEVERSPSSLEVDTCCLPRLTVSTTMEWKPIEGAECVYLSSSTPQEQLQNFSTDSNSGHLYMSHSSPMCVSTPDISQANECIDEQLSQAACTQSKPKHQKSHTTTCRLLSRSQAGLNRSRSKSLNCDPESPIHKRIACDFEKDLTFHPRLNEYSLKLVSQSSRKTVPLVHRLLEAKKNMADPYDDRLTFAPKLNPTSLKMAQDRAARMPEVQARMAEQATARRAEALSEYTFKPRVSVRSLKIAQSLGTSFHTRQQMYLERRQKAIDEAYKAPPAVSKRVVKPNHRVPPLPHNTSKETSRKTEHKDSITSPSRPSKLHLYSTDTTIPESYTSTPANMDTESLMSPTKVKGQDYDTFAQSRFKGHKETTSSPSKVKGHRARFKRESSVSQDVCDVSLSGPKFSAMSDSDRVRRVKVKSERIVKAKKVFLIMDGYRLIRRGMRRRGWVEQDYHKATPTSSPKKVVKSEGGGASDDSDCGDDLCEDEEVYSDEEEYSMMSRAVRNAVPNFVWSLKRYESIYRNLNKDSLVNHFAKASSFTTKVGLCSNLRNLVWYGDTDPNTFFPRCYKLSCNEEKEAFIDDYRMTSALCILKLLPTQYTVRIDEEPLSLSIDESVTASAPRRPSTASSRPSTARSCASGTRQVLSGEGLTLALKAIRAFISSKQHEDIEGSQIQLHPRLSEPEWCLLIKYFYEMVFERAVVHIPDCSVISQANTLLDEVEPYCPQLHLDGSRNIWIVKPGAMSRGRGITCMNNLEDILSLVASSVKIKESKWVVQKYIERPLLVYDTKFDVRQWFLVTDWNPLTMWIYKECYMRFCTQTYTLDDLDESVHLCNNSIQRNYTNSKSRAQALPEDNMWDSATFQNYLESIGEGDKWDGVIYPGMKEALVHVLQVTQDEIEHRKCSFELYGADFMLTSDYRPWLIEVNSSPSMSLSTATTNRLCKAVLEDTLKVVVDRRDDKDCDTGGFELAYKQVKLDQPTYVGMQLCVHGSSIPKPREPTFIRKTTSLTLNRPSPTKQILSSPQKAYKIKNSEPELPTDSKVTSEGDNVRISTPRITNCTLDCETPPQKAHSPIKSARRRVVPRSKQTVSGSPVQELIGGPRLGENIPNKLTTGEGMAISTSTGNVNAAVRFTRKPSPNR